MNALKFPAFLLTAIGLVWSSSHLHAIDVPTPLAGKYVIESPQISTYGAFHYSFTGGGTYSGLNATPSVVPQTPWVTLTGAELAIDLNALPQTFDSGTITFNVDLGGTQHAVTVKVVRVPDWWFGAQISKNSIGGAFSNTTNPEACPLFRPLDNMNYDAAVTIPEAMAVTDAFATAFTSSVSPGLPDNSVLSAKLADVLLAWRNAPSTVQGEHGLVTSGQLAYLGQAAYFSLQGFDLEPGGEAGVPVLPPYTRDAQGAVVPPWPVEFDADEIQEAATLGQLKALFRLDFQSAGKTLRDRFSSAGAALAVLDQWFSGVKASDTQVDWSALSAKLTKLKQGATAPAVNWRSFDWKNYAGSISEENASRFLWQAAWGASPQDIEIVKTNGYNTWIQNQLAGPAPATYSPAKISQSGPDWHNVGQANCNFMPEGQSPYIMAHQYAEYTSPWANFAGSISYQNSVGTASTITFPYATQPQPVPYEAYLPTYTTAIPADGIIATFNPSSSSSLVAGCYFCYSAAYYIPAQWQTEPESTYYIEIDCPSQAAVQIVPDPETGTLGAPVEDFQKAVTGRGHDGQKRYVQIVKGSGTDKTAVGMRIRWQTGTTPAVPTIIFRVLGPDMRPAPVGPGKEIGIHLGIFRHDLAYTKDELADFLKRSSWRDLFPNGSGGYEPSTFVSYPWDWLRLAVPKAQSGCLGVIPYAAWPGTHKLPQEITELWASPGFDASRSIEGKLFYLQWRRSTRDAFPWNTSVHGYADPSAGNFLINTRLLREDQSLVKHDGQWRGIAYETFADLSPEALSALRTQPSAPLPTGANTDKQLKYDWGSMAYGQGAYGRVAGFDDFNTAFMQQAIHQPGDQLRQRSAWALSQIQVISARHPAFAQMYHQSWGFANYWDLLKTYAFGDYAALTKRAAFHPLMGVYLSSANNQREHLVLKSHTNPRIKFMRTTSSIPEEAVLGTEFRQGSSDSIQLLDGSATVSIFKCWAKNGAGTVDVTSGTDVVTTYTALQSKTDVVRPSYGTPPGLLVRSRTAFNVSNFTSNLTDVPGLPVYKDDSQSVSQARCVIHDPGYNFFNTAATACWLDGSPATYDSLKNEGKVFEFVLADENYARELMQLFTLGVYKLGANGRSDAEIYSQQDVTEMARVFTGLSPQSMPGNHVWGNSSWPQMESAFQYNRPMAVFPVYHDFGEKTILGQTFGWASNDTLKTAIAAHHNAYFRGAGEPEATYASLSARKIDRAMAALAAQEISQVVDYLVHETIPAGKTDGGHGAEIRENTSRYISRLMIQHLVASNPSWTYVEDVAKVFRSAPKAQQMGKVVEAILLHSEARDWRSFMADRQSGRILDPMVRYLGLIRTSDAGAAAIDFKAGTSAAAQNPLNDLTWPQPLTPSQPMTSGLSAYNVSVFQAPSVFNFYQPDHQPAGRLSRLGLRAPEMQIHGGAQILTGWFGVLRDISPGAVAAETPGTVTDPANAALLGLLAADQTFRHHGIVDEAQSSANTNWQYRFPGFAGAFTNEYWNTRMAGTIAQAAKDTGGAILQADWEKFHTTTNGTYDEDATIDKLDVAFTRGRLTYVSRQAVQAVNTAGLPETPAGRRERVRRLAAVILSLPEAYSLK